MPLSEASENDDNRSPEDLSLEDFRRLGVRPFECRQTVIRLGAIRSSRTIAKQQLSAPSDQRTRQLAKITVSAYRLLDPRRRDDPIQRALVGRIMPQVVSVAGQTRFLSGGKGPAERHVPVDVLGSQDQHDHFLSSETETPPAWTISLNEKDLIQQSFQQRKRSRFRLRKRSSRSHYVWAGLVSGGLVFGVILGLAYVGDRAASRPQSQGRSGSTFDDDSTAKRGAIEPDGSIPNHGELAEPESPIDTSTGQTLAVPVSDPEPAEQTAPIVPAQTVIVPTVDIARVGDKANRVDDANPVQETEMQPPVEIALNPKIEQPKLAAPYERLDEVSIRAARRSMTSQIPELSESIDIATVADRIMQIGDFRDRQSVGSAEHWTATIALVEHQWLVNQAGQVIRQIESLSETYTIQLPTDTSASFIAACSIARLPETQMHLFEQGMFLADYLLVNESPDQCKQVIETLTKIDRHLDEPQAQERLQQFAKSAEQMERLFSATNRWIRRDDKTVLTKDAGVAGRYYCLMLRRWEVGLPWIVAASDSQIARIAQQDLEAMDASNRFLVAEQWIEIADRYQGRRADSMRLRGIELMRESMDEVTGIGRLEAERRIEETEKLLPPELRSGRSGS